MARDVVQGCNVPCRARSANSQRQPLGPDPSCINMSGRTPRGEIEGHGSDRTHDLWRRKNKAQSGRKSQEPASGRVNSYPTRSVTCACMMVSTALVVPDDPS
nr:hypothetical protein CFP56_52487 [Quercus suber]